MKFNVYKKFIQTNLFQNVKVKNLDNWALRKVNENQYLLEIVFLL